MSIETIYMPLLNEGVDVWAPVRAEKLGDSRFLVLGPMPDHEEWKFAANSIVVAHRVNFAGGKHGLAAYQIATES